MISFLQYMNPLAIFLQRFFHYVFIFFSFASKLIDVLMSFITYHIFVLHIPFNSEPGHLHGMIYQCLGGCVHYCSVTIISIKVTKRNVTYVLYLSSPNNGTFRSLCFFLSKITRMFFLKGSSVVKVSWHSPDSSVPTFISWKYINNRININDYSISVVWKN